jgi:hypothetical protein
MFAIADPVGYVDAHGGAAAFGAAQLNVASVPTVQMSPIGATPTPLPGTMLMQQPATTTLGGAAGTFEAPPKKGKAGLVIGLGVALAAAGGAVAFLMNRGGGSSSGDAVAAVTTDGEATDDPATPDPIAKTTPDPATDGTRRDPAGGDGTAEVKPETPEVKPDPPPLPTKVSVIVETTPKGAKVFVGTEKKPRGTTPYTLELDRSDAEVQIRLERSGYEDEQRTVSLAGDTTLGIELEKKGRKVSGGGKAGGDGGKSGGGKSGGGKSGGGKSGGGDGGDTDDTMNPFKRGN